MVLPNLIIYVLLHDKFYRFLAQIGALVLLNEGDNIMDLKDIFRKCADRRYGCTWESFEAYRYGTLFYEMKIYACILFCTSTRILGKILGSLNQAKLRIIKSKNVQMCNNCFS